MLYLTAAGGVLKRHGQLSYMASWLLDAGPQCIWCTPGALSLAHIHPSCLLLTFDAASLLLTFSAASLLLACCSAPACCCKAACAICSLLGLNAALLQRCSLLVSFARPCLSASQQC